jgi:hypothetical protein
MLCIEERVANDTLPVRVVIGITRLRRRLAWMKWKVEVDEIVTRVDINLQGSQVVNPREKSHREPD